jgi:hypothetical protein
MADSVMEKVMKTRDIVVEHSKLRRLVGFTYIHEKLDCTPDQAERAVQRALELYPSLHEVKLFDAYRYYHHVSLSGEELDAALGYSRALVIVEDRLSAVPAASMAPVLFVLLVMAATKAAPEGMAAPLTLPGY